MSSKKRGDEEDSGSSSYRPSVSPSWEPSFNTFRWVSRCVEHWSCCYCPSLVNYGQYCWVTNYFSSIHYRTGVALQAVAIRSIATSPVSRGEKTTWSSTSDSRHTQLSRSYSPAKCLSGRGVHNLLWKATVSPWLTSFLSSEKLQRPSVIPQKSIFGIYSRFWVASVEDRDCRTPQIPPNITLHAAHCESAWGVLFWNLDSGRLLSLGKTKLCVKFNHVSFTIPVRRKEKIVFYNNSDHVSHGTFNTILLIPHSKIMALQHTLSSQLEMQVQVLKGLRYFFFSASGMQRGIGILPRTYLLAPVLHGIINTGRFLPTAA